MTKFVHTKDDIKDISNQIKSGFEKYLLYCFNSIEIASWMKVWISWRQARVTHDCREETEIMCGYDH